MDSAFVPHPARSGRPLLGSILAAVVATTTVILAVGACSPTPSATASIPPDATGSLLPAATATALPTNAAASP